MKYQGFEIYEGTDGFWWQNGGYFESIESCKADIADYNRSENQRRWQEEQKQLPPYWDAR